MDRMRDFSGRQEQEHGSPSRQKSSWSLPVRVCRAGYLITRLKQVIFHSLVYDSISGTIKTIITSRFGDMGLSK